MAIALMEQSDRLYSTVNPNHKPIMKSGMTSLLYVCSNADTRTAVRLAVDLETGEYVTYLNRNQGEPEHDERGHYFKCEGATHLAHKFALDDFFQRLDKGT